MTNKLSGAESTDVEVIRTYLQLESPSQLSSAKLDDDNIRIAKLDACPASFYRYLYAEVGRLYHWVDRLEWSDADIRTHLANPRLSLWLMTYLESPAGYFELEGHRDGSVEIAYFGLLQEFLGRGLGGHLLTRAGEEAWSAGANRVWLHTCTLDDPGALPNYLKRGFRPFKVERYSTVLGEHEQVKSRMRANKES
jgi:GNAT superfamily N-acetyltransferase